MSRSHLLCFCFVFWLGYVNGGYKFNALVCDLRAPELAIIKECIIKAIDRRHNMINVNAHLLKTITELSIHFKFVKRERGLLITRSGSLPADLKEFPFRRPR